MASWSSSRAVKYRHLLNEELRLSSAEMALLAVLMLRGPQTPGELRQRSERLHAFASGEEVDAALEALIERGFAGRLPRRPGQREQRYAQLLGGELPPELESPQGAVPAVAEDRPVAASQPAGSTRAGALEAADPPSAAVLPAASAGMSADHGLERRVGELEREVQELREGLRELREELGA